MCDYSAWSDYFFPLYLEYMKNVKKKNGKFRIGITLYGLTWGGATRRVISLARGFMERGHDVKIIIVEKGQYLDNDTEGLEIIELEHRFLGHFLKNAPKKRKLDFSKYPLARYLREKKIDILMSGGNNAHLAAISAKQLSKTDIPLILRLSNPLKASLGQKQKLRRKIRFLKSCRYYPKADGFIAVSKSTAQDISDVTGIPLEKIDVVYNPMFTPEMMEKAREKISHPWLKARNKNEIPVIVAAGRLVVQKNFELLINAFARAVEKRDMRLIILGEGKRRKHLKKLIADLDLANRVDLHGVVPNPMAYMARADLFCLSSRWEGLPGVLIEALSAGCPVISTDCPGGAAEILDHGKFGILTPVDDEKALARSILKALDTAWDSSKLRKRARFFSVEKRDMRLIILGEGKRRKHLKKLIA
ncbi:MAG: hypothetical protein DSZ23_00105, partial [Thermodesulfatator sp.]